MKTCSCLMLLLLLPATIDAQMGESLGAMRAKTIPSADVTLSFVQPGRITDVLLKEGDAVQASQVVAKQDNTVEMVQLLQLQAESENITRIDASEASLQQKRVDLQRIEKAANRNAATDLEVQHAALEARIAELSLHLAKFEHKQAQLKLTEGQARVERMIIKSPIQGVVEKVHVEKGESVNALDEVIQLVRIDPLWVETILPLDKARKLSAGQQVRVQFTSEPPATVIGRVIHVAAVGDPASGTLRARIEVPNESKRPAGEYVLVYTNPVTQ
ncbi:efflux RND transporter periplasmic adaptor subunit [Planctomycetota bacterium]